MNKFFFYKIFTTYPKLGVHEPLLMSIYDVMVKQYDDIWSLWWYMTIFLCRWAMKWALPCQKVKKWTVLNSNGWICLLILMERQTYFQLSLLDWFWCHQQTAGKRLKYERLLHVANLNNFRLNQSEPWEKKKILPKIKPYWPLLNC